MFPAVIKKYGNRRLYDTEASRYITLDELASKIQGGRDVRVVDAKNGDDLTQVTLTQIIIEGRAAARLLPVSLLAQLIRLGPDALAEFLGHHLGAALSAFLRGSTPAEPAPADPTPRSLDAHSALGRLFMAPHGWAEDPSAVPLPSVAAEASPTPRTQPTESEVAALRRELDELKRSIGRGRRRR
jgi:polyhydroxyalkanoate synthesis repressor PhaR